MDDYNDLVNWEDWRLNESVGYYERGIEETRKQLQHWESGLRNIQAELDRRALDAWWAAHPEQTRVNVGDVVLNPTVAEYPSEIQSIDIEDETCVIKWWVYDKMMNPHYWVVSMAKAQEYRRAYLQAHPESEDDR